MIGLPVGIVLIAVSFILNGSLSQKPNMLMGYRTPMSMKNIETWKVAQNFSGQLSLKLGILSCVIGLIFIFFTHEFKETFFFWIDFSISMCLTFSIIILTERHLKEIFNNNGELK